MANKLYEENSISAIASAIRSKLGVATQYKVADMASAVSSIPTGTTPTGTINITANGDTDVTNYAMAHVAVPQPTGKVTITANGTNIDVSQYASADVAVPNQASGKITISANGTDIDVSSYATADVAVPGPTGNINIDRNGTFDVSAYASAIVSVSGGSGLPSNIHTGTVTGTGNLNDGFTINENFSKAPTLIYLFLQDYVDPSTLVTSEAIMYECHYLYNVNNQAMRKANNATTITYVNTACIENVSTTGFTVKTSNTNTKFLNATYRWIAIE